MISSFKIKESNDILSHTQWKVPSLVKMKCTETDEDFLCSYKVCNIYISLQKNLAGNISVSWVSKILCYLLVLQYLWKIYM